MYIRTSSFVSFETNVFHSTLGLLTHNATWCQNRGCICISSTRRTYGRIHAVWCIHPVIQTRTIILHTELFPKERREREKIQGEILQGPQRPSFQLESKSVSSVSTCNPATTTSLFPHLIMHTELILLLPQELQRYYNYKAHPVQAYSSNCSPCIQAFYTAESRLQAPYSVPGPYSTSRLPVNSTRQKQHSTRQPAFTQPFQ